MQVNEHMFSEIRYHIEKKIQCFEETQDIVFQSMNKDRKKVHIFFFFFYTEDDRKRTRSHARNWLSTIFSQNNIQLSATYKVEVNNVSVDTVINLVSNRVTKTVEQAISYKSRYSIARMEWLSGCKRKIQLYDNLN